MLTAPIVPTIKPIQNMLLCGQKFSFIARRELNHEIMINSTLRHILYFALLRIGGWSVCPNGVNIDRCCVGILGLLLGSPTAEERRSQTAVQQLQASLSLTEHFTLWEC